MTLATISSRTGRPVVSEEAIQRALVHHLQMRAASGIFYWHTPNGGSRNKIEAARFKNLGVVAGIPDITVLVGGQVKFLELKTEAGRLSPAQEIVHDRIRAAGCEVAVAYGLEEALAQLTSWRCIR